MSLLHFDGFDRDAATNLSRYDSYGGTPGWVAGRPGSLSPYPGAMVITDDGYVVKEFPANVLNTFSAGAAVRFMLTPDNDKAVFRFRNGVTDQVVLRFRRDRRLAVYRQNSNLLIGPPSPVLSLNQWYHVQLVAVIDNGVGHTELYLDEVLVSQGDGDTQGAASPAVTTLRIGDGALSTSLFHIDDLWVTDEAGTRGDLRVYTWMPAGDGAVNGWAGAGGHYEAVDDVTPDGDGTYLSATGPATELYTFPAVGGEITIHGLQTSVVARRDGTEVVTVSNVARDGSGVQHLVGGGTVGSSYRPITGLMEVRPDTAGGWSPAVVGDFQFGFRHG